MSDSPTIVCVSLNPAIDRVIETPELTLGAHQQGRDVSRTPGGKAVNVSRVLAALNTASVATGFLGAENRSAFAPAFASPLVRDEFFTLDGWTRENVTLADPVAAQETHIRCGGLAPSERFVERLARKLDLLCRSDATVVFAGSLPPEMTPETFRSLVDVCLDAGARAAVDTHGPALAAVADCPLWLVKPNAAELAQLAGRELGDEAELFRAARALTDHVEMVLLSRGEKGACLFTRDEALSAVAAVPQEDLRNTVGCGDALLAAFVAGLCSGAGLRDALAGAVATASASACTLRSATFEPDVRDALRETVAVRELE